MNGYLIGTYLLVDWWKVKFLASDIYLREFDYAFSKCESMVLESGELILMLLEATPMFSIINRNPNSFEIDVSDKVDPSREQHHSRACINHGGKRSGFVQQSWMLSKLLSLSFNS